VTGIDLAKPSLALARQRTAQAGLAERCRWLCMDAQSLDFADEHFDVVACVQNGIAAFGADPLRLAREAWRVLRPAGRLMLSTYVDAIWPERLAWFEAQAAAGLVGPVDRVASRDGTIVCTDGFRSGRATVADFNALALALGVPAAIDEVDASSLWCELRKPGPATDFSSSSTGADSVPTFTRSQ
jgi:SAM-dependent methyltransferase